ncbi:MAG: hypothetical protein PVH82_08200, partial [Desulfobacteraceae bacterium]
MRYPEHPGNPVQDIFASVCGQFQGKMANYVTKEMKRLMGKAIHSQQMIDDGDHVLVAVSGGKDSMSLLWLLR